MEYRMTLAVDRCSALTFSFLAASWWKIHSHALEFLSAVFFHVRYTLSIIVRRCLKSPRFVPYLHIGKTWPFSLPGTWSKVSSTKKNNAKYFRVKKLIWGKSVPQTACLSSEVNKYTAELSFGSSRNTLSGRAHLMSTEICIKLFTRRRDRQSWFSISLNFYQTILESSPQTRFMFDIKKSL